MASYTQEERRLVLETSLGKDALLLTRFTGREEMSRLFSFSLEMLAEKDSLGARDLVGKNVTATVKLVDGSERHWNGFVSRFSYCGTDDRLSRYTAEVVPWLWFLTRTADCRIFQQKSVPQIIEQVFADLGFSDYEKSGLKGDHPPWDYCVQYRETDFNFISRLMEQEGIFYYFRHQKGKHVLVLADQKGAYHECPEKEVEFAAGPEASARDDLITSWEHRWQYRSGKWAQTDYNFETPGTNLMTRCASVIKLDSTDKYEIYDYPGEYEKKAEGEAEVKIRMEEEEVAHDVVVGSGRCRTFSPGGKFKLKGHHSASEQGKGYVLVAVDHSAAQAGSYTSGGSAGETDYHNSFTCIPDSLTFRPARVTPRPVVQGVQTAVVVGPGGEEVFTDKYGRVKVQFFWDREGKKDDHSSSWVRVSQPWAGKSWGAMHIPRIGQEVIVDFLEGDPDRPIITGRVYNAEQMPPYELPANKTQSGLKSRSSPGGEADHFNEIRIEDKKGSEQIFIHAEKNQDLEVENDETHSVGHDRKKTIDHDETTQVKHDRTETVDNDEKITIHGNRTETVDKDEKIAIHQNRTETVDKDETITIHQNRTEKVDQDEKITIGQNRTEDVAKNQSVTVGSNDTLDVGKVLTINAGESITLKTGKASISMSKDGTITIKGQDITVDGGGEILEKAVKNIVMKGQKILQN